MAVKIIHPILALCALLGILKLTLSIRAPFTLSSPRNPGSLNRRLQLEDEVAPIVKRFLQLRVGSSDNKQKSAFWYYTGSVRDPVSGREIVGIEGVEKISVITSDLTSFLGSPAAANNFSQAIADQFLHTPMSSQSTSTAKSYLSHKLFLYVDAQNRTSPVSSFRKSRMAPARSVNPFKELLEWVQLDVNSVSVESNSKEAGDGAPRSNCRVISTVMWPGGRTMEGRLFLESLDTATTGIASPNLSPSAMGIAVHHTILGRKLKPVNKWIAFGPSQEGSVGKSSEVYRLQENRSPHMVLNPWSKMKKLSAEDSYLAHSPIRMFYKRYGTAPAWMAPQRPCEIELYGYRIDNPNWLPSATKELFQSYANEFFVTSNPSTAALVDEKNDPYFKYKPWYTKLATLLKH